MRKLVVAITGASGSIYAYRLLEYLRRLRETESMEIALIFSENAPTVWQWELNLPPPDDFPIYGLKDYFAPFASGSARYEAMVIIPCSMGTAGRIAAGISDDLITRTADVMLKERRRLLIVPRETPLHAGHLENLLRLAQLGALIIPAMPSFYSRPSTIEELVDTVTLRVLDHLGFPLQQKRWGSESPSRPI
ncbi:MAG: UbiX family flavin prenyltransferase [Bacteroidia bacterium]|nr:UbiX family flavin prenyltransferase [Bacteroidia bacterium]MCX7764436.1 UbiX family flavin prenyltransferase [Bacteroidia bacterium]MDW8057299.1 UbiX family flavin prenyltransferase [Bacteroidia bacterium]